MDTNLDGKGPLQVKGEVFTKGLAVHAHTELTYNLDGKYKKLEAVIGMDDAVGGDGQPRVRIEADGRELFGQIISRKDERHNLDLDVGGVRQLRVIVSSAKPFAFEAHVDLANAKLSK
jgi:alpha-galactosidase